MNWTLLDMFLEMLKRHSVPKRFWADAIESARHALICIISKVVRSSVPPQEFWHGENPDLWHFHIFGCQCWCHIRKKNLGSGVTKDVLHHLSGIVTSARLTSCGTMTSINCKCLETSLLVMVNLVSSLGCRKSQNLLLVWNWRKKVILSQLVLNMQKELKLLKSTVCL